MDTSGYLLAPPGTTDPNGFVFAPVGTLMVDQARDAGYVVKPVFTLADQTAQKLASGVLTVVMGSNNYDAALVEQVADVVTETLASLTAEG